MCDWAGQWVGGLIILFSRPGREEIVESSAVLRPNTVISSRFPIRSPLDRFGDGNPMVVGNTENKMEELKISLDFNMKYIIEMFKYNYERFY